MKNLLCNLCCSLILMSFAFQSSAQNALGLSTGANFANQTYHYNNPIFAASKNKFALYQRSALNFDYHLNSKLTAAFEAAFAQKGYRLTDLTDADGARLPNASYRLRFNFLEAGVQIKYHLSTGKIRPYLLAGTSIGLLVNGKGISRGVPIEGSTAPIKRALDMSDYKKSDFSVDGGAGIEFEIVHWGFLFLESRYQQGLSDLSQSSASTVNNVGISLTAGVAYALGKKV